MAIACRNQRGSPNGSLGRCTMLRSYLKLPRDITIMTLSQTDRLSVKKRNFQNHGCVPPSVSHHLSAQKWPYQTVHEPLPLEGLSLGIQSKSMHLIAWKNDEGGTYSSNANEFEAGSWD